MDGNPLSATLFDLKLQENYAYLFIWDQKTKMDYIKVRCRSV